MSSRAARLTSPALRCVNIGIVDAAGCVSIRKDEDVVVLVDDAMRVALAIGGAKRTAFRAADVLGKPCPVDALAPGQNQTAYEIKIAAAEERLGSPAATERAVPQPG